jgi:hypothetical protein
MTLAEIRRSVRPGQVYEVIHYVPRPSRLHRGVVVRVTSRAIILKVPGGDCERIRWPKAPQAVMDADGTIRLYSDGPGAASRDMMVTLIPRCTRCGDLYPADEIDGAPMCSGCACELAAHTDAGALDQIAALLGQEEGATRKLSKIADILTATGRSASTGVETGQAPRPSGPADDYRFALDDEAAAAWLAQAIRQFDGGPAADGLDHDDGLPDVGASWQPASDGHGNTVNELLAKARGAGVLTCPPGWSITYEYVRDADGCGYRWLLTSMDERCPLIVADAFTDTWGRGEGQEAALDLLADAVIAGNGLLADLGTYTAAARRPVPPPQVWILEYVHKHGTVITAYASEAGAVAAAASIARDGWDNVAGLGDIPAAPDALGGADAACSYFAGRPDEEHYIFPAEVTGVVAARDPRQAGAAETLGPLARQLSADDIEALIITAAECWAHARDPGMRNVASERQRQLAKGAWQLVNAAADRDGDRCDV